MQFAYAVLLRVGRLHEEDDEEEAGRLNEEDDEEEEAGRLKEEDDRWHLGVAWCCRHERLPLFMLYDIASQGQSSFDIDYIATCAFPFSSLSFSGASYVRGARMLPTTLNGSRRKSGSNGMIGGRISPLVAGGGPFVLPTP